MMPERRRKRPVWGVGRWRAHWSTLSPETAPAPVDWRADTSVPMAARCPVLTRQCDASSSVREVVLWGRCRSRFLPPPTRRVPLAITIAHTLASSTASIRTGPTLTAEAALWWLTRP